FPPKEEWPEQLLRGHLRSGLQMVDTLDLCKMVSFLWLHSVGTSFHLGIPCPPAKSSPPTVVALALRPGSGLSMPGVGQKNPCPMILRKNICGLVSSRHQDQGLCLPIQCRPALKSGKPKMTVPRRILPRATPILWIRHGRPMKSTSCMCQTGHPMGHLAETNDSRSVTF